jgi:iron complex transport system ATP-binding protein
MSIIEIKNLNFFYDYQKKVISDLNASFNNGITVLAGPNGSGKTTLLKIISRIIESYSGIIKIFGRDIREYKKKEFAKIVSFVNLDISLPFNFKVIDILLMGRISYLDFFSDYSDDDYAFVLNIAKETKIEHLLNRNFLEISSGEKELVLLTQSFVQDSPILLMDEPFIHLDLKHKLNLLNIFKNYIQKKNGCGIIVIHDLKIAQKISDNIAFIKNGRIVEKIRSSSLKENIGLIADIYNVEEEDVENFLF